MGKKKKKTKTGVDLADRLAEAIESGEAPQPLAADLARGGLGEDAIAEAFARSVELLRSGSDPRELAKLPVPFQLAFLRLAAGEGDDDQLNDLASMTADKNVKKEARRLLHAMRSRGADVDIAEDSGHSVLDRARREEDRPLPCFLAPVSGSGSQMLWMARYTRGGVAVYQGQLHPSDGLVDFAGGTIGRNRYRELARQMAEEDSELLLEISFAEARLLLARSVEQSRAAGKSLPDGYLEVSGELGDVDSSATTPSAEEIFPAGAPDAEALRDSASLLERPELADWLPDEETIRTLDEKIKEVEQSQLLIDDKQRIEQVERIMDTAVESMLEPLERRQDYTRRLLAMALLYFRLDRTEQARQAAAAGRHLEVESFQATDNPFFVRMIRRAFFSPAEIVERMSKPQAEKKPDDDASSGNLIVPP
ncbi:MAG: hypothetical protein JXR96_24475 [Deltaproteobacteria bacterium]|nr:hypothetical protein [Deltaproteobacteria bacterium]